MQDAALLGTATPTLDARSEWAKGWGIVLVAAFGVALGGIHFHFIGVMIKPLQAAYGWSRGEISFGLTLISLVQIVAFIGVGILLDRIGARRVALYGCWLFAVGFSLMGLAGPSLTSWYLACGLFALIAQGVSSAVWTCGIVRRFDKHRGMALAVALSASGVTVALTPILTVWLVDAVGVRWIFPVIGFGGMSLVFVLTWLLFRDEVPAAIQQNASPAPALVGCSLQQAWRSRQFWQLLGSFILVAAATGTLMIHSQPMLMDSGLSPEKAASVAFFIGPSMIFGRLLMGLLFDYLDTRLVAALAYAFPLFAAVLMLLLDGNYLLAAWAGIFIGLCMGAEIDALAYLTSRYFGRKAYGTLFAILASAYGIGIGAGSALAGAVFDAQGSYQNWLLAMCVGALMAIVLVTSMGRPPVFSAAGE